MKTVQNNAEEFYHLLLEEEKALISLDLDRLTKIRLKKSKYLEWLESILRNKEHLVLLDKEMIAKIRKKNMILANLYKFSLSLFKKDDSYGNKELNSIPNLSIKA